MHRIVQTKIEDRIGIWLYKDMASSMVNIKESAFPTQYRSSSMRVVIQVDVATNTQLP